MSSPDAAVVGAGIVGTACAYFLAKEGLRVALLESRFAGGGTTAAGMGHIVVMDDSPAQLALTKLGRDLWTELAHELPRSCEDDPCGTLWVAADEEELALVATKRRLYAEHGVDSSVLDAGETARAEPNLRRGIAGALLVPGDRVLYPPNAARHLAERAAALGAERRDGCAVTAVRARGVETSSGPVDAGVVVNAAGPEAPALTPGLPIAPRKGHLVITDRYPGFCRHQLVELGYLKSAHGSGKESVAFNVQPRATGQLLIGSSREYAGWDASINRAIVSRMLARAVEFLPGIASLSAIRTWTGFRPATPDKLPLVGPWGAVPGLWVAAGHEGLGITTALATGRLLADLVVGRAPVLDPAPFAPSRAMPEAH
jgi:glycine/D-amino acid oxidase-like deaminating enzyme